MMEQTGGSTKLAATLQSRMKQVNNNQNKTAVELGTINGDMSLQLTGDLPAIPQSDYMVCRTACIGAVTIKTSTEPDHTHTIPAGSTEDGGEPEHAHDITEGETEESGTHHHTFTRPSYLRPLQAGDRVLVTWAGTDAVIVDVVLPGGQNFTS